MLQLCYFAFAFLCCPLFFPVLSLQCNHTQYVWPVDRPTLCCNKCLPGQHMVRRSDNVCDTTCRPCTVNRYTDTYNVEMSCNICENCNKTNMEYMSLCNSTHNAVCRCKAGYVCNEQPCKECVPIPSTAKPTFPPSTTALEDASLTTIWVPPKPLRDTAWFLVIIGLLSIGFLFFIVTKIKPFLHWIKSKQDSFLPCKKRVPPDSEDEDVSKPIQEMCGKCVLRSKDEILSLD